MERLSQDTYIHEEGGEHTHTHVHTHRYISVTTALSSMLFVQRGEAVLGASALWSWLLKQGSDDMTSVISWMVSIFV